MVQGTMSNVGKSFICAGLCRIFHEDGYRAAPFKSQNMALNSYITKDGLEMGRAQAVQAEAAGIEPSVLMNPILLKPVSDQGSQVILNGEVLGNRTASEYYAMKHTLLPAVCKAYETLSRQNDIVVIEGAGSPVEINLNQDDFVNMGMAKISGAPVLLVGDIDRGGVFAQLFGTVGLLKPEEKAMVKAVIINKFRGDIALFKSGLSMLEELVKIPAAGVLPYRRIDIDEEDSLSERLQNKKAREGLDAAVIRLPHLSNFTDFSALEASDGISVRYVEKAEELGQPDLTILPGTKNTLQDLRWLRKSGIGEEIQKLAENRKEILGICGGYQMLGKEITDPEGTEGGGREKGLCLLPASTVFRPEKRRTRVRGAIIPNTASAVFTKEADVEGYEIHMGETRLFPGGKPFVKLEGGGTDGCCCANVSGTYLHGFFDTKACRMLLTKSGQTIDFSGYKEEQYYLLAEHLRTHLDMKLIYRILEEGI